MGEVSPPALTGRWLIQCDIPSKPHVTGPGADLDLGHVPGYPAAGPESVTAGGQPGFRWDWLFRELTNSPPDSLAPSHVESHVATAGRCVERVW